MARIARVVVPGIPHHITQRGNRRPDWQELLATGLSDDDHKIFAVTKEPAGRWEMKILLINLSNLLPVCLEKRSRAKEG
ncbi:MAG: hypothetical protein U9R66_12195 [Thermodesulfobacteriota bacterium]|nr:hypothetical protein [Thermodesulfobacteriota bacterium]